MLKNDYKSFVYDVVIHGGICMKTVKILLLMAISTLMSCAYGMDAILAQIDAVGDKPELKIAACKAAKGKLADATGVHLVMLCTKLRIERLGFNGKTAENLAAFRAYVAAQLDLLSEQVKAGMPLAPDKSAATYAGTELVEAERAISASREREAQIVALVRAQFQTMQKLVTTAVQTQADYARSTSQLRGETRSLEEQLAAKTAEVKALRETLSLLQRGLAANGAVLEDFVKESE